MDINKIGEFIATKRKEKGLTQQELGNKLFVTDKAVSKWERGISLPEVTILYKLAEELDLTIEDILNGEIKDNSDLDIDKRIKEIKEEIRISNNKKIKKVIISFTILILILFLVIFKNVYMGYNLKNIYYEHSKKNITIGLPKLSFFIKKNDQSYKAYNLRSSYVLETEVKRYLKTLKYTNCNDTIYYYDEKNDISIIEYKIKNNILFNTISYEIVDHDYCELKHESDYGRKLNGTKRFHLLNGGKLTTSMKGNIMEMVFIDGIEYDPNKKYDLKEFLPFNDKHYTYKAQLIVYYYIEVERMNDVGYVERQLIEDSVGSIEIKDNKLYYYREKVFESIVKTPEVSVFEIGEEGELTLTDNYLNKYQKEITLY